MHRTSFLSFLKEIDHHEVVYTHEVVSHNVWWILFLVHIAHWKYPYLRPRLAMYFNHKVTNSAMTFDAYPKCEPDFINVRTPCLSVPWAQPLAHLTTDATHRQCRCCATLEATTLHQHNWCWSMWVTCTRRSSGALSAVSISPILEFKWQLPSLRILVAIAIRSK